MVDPKSVKLLRDRLVASGMNVTMADKVYEVFSLPEVQAGIAMATLDIGKTSFRLGFATGAVLVGLVVLVAKYVF